MQWIYDQLVEMGLRERTNPIVSDKSDGVRIALFTLLNNRGLDRLSELGGSERGRTGQTVSDRSDRDSGEPKCQCSLCHDCGNRLPGGAVMAPLRRAGLCRIDQGWKGNNRDLKRGREGFREGLPFRSPPLRAVDRVAG